MRYTDQSGKIYEFICEVTNKLTNEKEVIFIDDEEKKNFSTSQEDFKNNYTLVKDSNHSSTIKDLKVDYYLPSNYIGMLAPVGDDLKVELLLPHRNEDEIVSGVELLFLAITIKSQSPDWCTMMVDEILTDMNSKEENENE